MHPTNPVRRSSGVRGTTHPDTFGYNPEQVLTLTGAGAELKWATNAVRTAGGTSQSF